MKYRVKYSCSVDFCPEMRYIFHMGKRQTEEKVFSFMEKHKMIRSGDKVILGVSGGADSVCLLFLLLEYQKKTAFEMLAVHVDHGIRGAAAREDAVYVEELCRQQGVAFRLERVDVKGFVKAEKCSEEDAGRRLRYEAFGKAAREFGGTKIAVAHNAEDRAETMLLHLFRGSGLKGMRGIEPVRAEIIGQGIPQTTADGKAEIIRRANIVRPVLCLKRGEIEEYLRESGISWRTDATNGEDEYARNRIRHHLLPWAEREISGRVVEHMCRTADILSETEGYLAQQTESALADCAARHVIGSTAGAAGVAGSVEIDVEGFLAYHSVIRKRMILRLAEELSPTGKDISAVHVEAVLGLFEKEGNRRIDLPFGIRFVRQYGKVVAAPGEQSKESRAGYRPCPEMAVPEPAELPESEFTYFFIKEGEEVPRNQYTKWFDCDKIKESPVWRFRQRGDYLTLADGAGNMIHKSVKDYMIGEKIPRGLRDIIPVLAEGSHVLWLAGYRISEYYKVDRNTKRVLQVKLKGKLPGQEQLPGK